MIKYENKPSIEIIDEYIKKIEYCLSGLNVKVKIKMYSEPIDIRSYMNGIETDSERHWFDSFYVDTPDVSNLKVRIFDPSFQLFSGDKLNPFAWTEAFMIQHQIYSSLNINPGNPKDGDRYWDLWHKI